LLRRSTPDVNEEEALAEACPTCWSAPGRFCTDEVTGNAVATHDDRKLLVRTLRETPAPRASWARRLLGLTVVFLFTGPFVVGIFLMEFVPVPLRSVPGGLLMVELGLAALWVLVRIVRPAPGAIPVGGFLGRHPTIAVPVLLLFGLIGLAFGLPCIADIAADPDVRTVTIIGVSRSARGGYETIRTTGRDYETAWFVTPRVGAGPATLTIGHYSGRVLKVVQ
jgi:hypothetical protein